MDPVSSRSVQGLMDTLSRPQSVRPGGGTGFADALKSALQEVSNQQGKADDLAARFQLNDPQVSIEDTMLAMQGASLSFQALVQVRNRVVSAYQDIMNMQV